MKTERTLSLADAIGKLIQQRDGHRDGAQFERSYRRRGSVLPPLNREARRLSIERERVDRMTANTLSYAIRVLRQVRR